MEDAAQLVDLAGTPTLSRTGSGSAKATLAVGGGGSSGVQDDFAGVDVRGRVATRFEHDQVDDRTSRRDTRSAPGGLVSP